MIGEISINLDEGPIQIFDGLKCESLLDKITVCKDCGKIHFLPVQVLGLCQNHEHETLGTVLKREKENLQKLLKTKLFKQVLFTGIYLCVSFFLYLFASNNAEADSLLDITLYTVYAAIFIILICLVYQIWSVNQTMQLMKDKDRFTAYWIHNFTPEKTVYQGQSWEQAINMAYAHEVGNLEKWAHLLNQNNGDNSDAWMTLYASAMELSYMNDCEELALLRLLCLERMRILPESYTDIRQILKILPDTVLYNWMEIVVTCIERLAVTFDEVTAERFVSLAAFSIRSLDSNPEILNKIKNQRAKKNQKKKFEESAQPLIRGFSAIGPYFILPAAEKYPELKKVIEITISKDPLFAEMEKMRKTG